ncbi:BMP family protein [Nakamurella lactea]|uniref:BMP family protein n=1 Tax=Nakamurella lactea TaxID=459515 RepID=UPI000410E79D|nr:BMP family protein [Nakamurella lactea]
MVVSPNRHTRSRARVRVVAAAAVLGLALAACGGNTGEAPTSEAGDGATATAGATTQTAGSAAGPSSEGAATGGSSGPGSSAPSGEKPLVYGVFATPLEEPWDGAIHAALQAAAADGTIVYKHTDNNDTPDKMTRTLTDVITTEKPAIIIGDSFAAEDQVRAVAAKYPETPFVFGSGGKTVDPNFSIFDNWLQDPAFLAGMLAGGMTKSNTIGVVAAMPIPEVNRIVNAFIAGVKESNDKATVKVTFINSFFDPATAKQAALAQVAAGVDVLFAERAGVIEAAKEKNLPVIGMMVDQKSEAPKNVVTSLVWNMRPTIDHIVHEYTKTGTVKAQDLAEFSFMKNGGSSIAPINTDVPGGVPDTVKSAVEAKQKAIEDGSFTTPVNEEAPAGSTTVGG